jgi:hypothetical protein
MDPSLHEAQAQAQDQDQTHPSLQSMAFVEIGTDGRRDCGGGEGGME